MGTITTTSVVLTIIYVILAVVGGILLFMNAERFDGHSAMTARGVRLYGLAFCMIIVLLGMASLALFAAGKG